MPKVTFRQDSIAGGISPTYLGDTKKGQYRIGLGIDPDISLTNAVTTNPDFKMSNIVNPVGYVKFSSTNVTSYPIQFIAPAESTTPLVFAILDNGRLISYSSVLALETLIGTVTGSVANGAAVYNDFIYITTGTDVSRYGPLSGSPTLTNTVWTGATLGNQTALTDTTYPAIRGPKLPNHWMHVHTDGQLYFLDFKDNQGLVHVIKTDSSGTDDGSAYNVLDLPFGYHPTAIESYGIDIAITAIQTTDTTLRQGNAALFLWDTISESFYQQIQLPDVYASALLNNNGRLYVFTGSGNTGSRVSLYEGGSSVQQVVFFDDGASPLPGAVGGFGDRVIFGAVSSSPVVAGVVFSFGSKQSDIPPAFHCPVKTTSGAANTPTCTAAAYVQQASGDTPRVIAGWGTSTTYGIDRFDRDYDTNPATFRTDIFQIGRKFKVERIRYNLSTDTSTGVRDVVCTVFTDNESASTALSSRDVEDAFVYKRPEINVRGEKNFLLDFTWSGAGELALMLPIEIDVEVYADQP